MRPALPSPRRPPTARARRWTRRSASKSRSGMPLPCGHGTLSSTTALSAETTSWTSASSVRQTKPLQRVRSALWPGVSATTHSTSIVSHVGSRPDKSARWTTATGSSRSMGAEMAQGNGARISVDGYAALCVMATQNEDTISDTLLTSEDCVQLAETASQRGPVGWAQLRMQEHTSQ